MGPHPNRILPLIPLCFSCFSFFSLSLSLFLSWKITHLRPTARWADDFILSFTSVSKALKEVCSFLGSNGSWSWKNTTVPQNPFMILEVWGETSTNRTPFLFRKESFFPLWTHNSLLLPYSWNSGLECPMVPGTKGLSAHMVWLRLSLDIICGTPLRTCHLFIAPWYSLGPSKLGWK